MAKMFYTLEETKSALGQNEDQIKQLTREGRLREFRDGPRLMFKSDQVDALKSQIGGSIEIGESGAPIGLADSGGGSATGTALTMADSVGSGMAGISGSGLSSGLAGHAGSGMMNLKDETALAADLSMGSMSGTMGSMSGSMTGTGLPSPGRGGTGSGSGVTGSMGSRQGINVFGDDTHAAADPMAQTAMAGSGSVHDLNLEGVGSGSGLLDLTRESDETSLGAELLDEISPATGRGRPMAPPDTGSMAGIKLDAPRGGVIRGTTGVREVEAYDSWAGAFGAASLGTGLFLLVAIFVLINATVGNQPDLVLTLSKQGNPFLIAAVIGLVVAVLFGAFGFLLEKSTKR